MALSSEMCSHVEDPDKPLNQYIPNDPCDVTKSYMSKRFMQTIDRLMEFNGTEFIDMVSESTL